MNRELIKAKARQMAAKINEIYGTRAIFRDSELMLAIAAQDSTINLGSGGFRETASFRIRFPATIIPPPALKEPVIEIGTGRKFYITGIRPASEDSAHAQEHIADAELA